ncbi:hypothetical protein B4589_015090 [Halolamina sp. CBA1230]|uniref:hypothetical protein n=1 Tax=Halolamina sp. CBA1230 TaxID=1853690 RepID=UPI00117A4F94|nr:hypothetical protein [Halolamina sp. CBA1230]QKY21634.1 hypothetical protein B4589_015090 [Halolamina sp. CBA1230]
MPPRDGPQTWRELPAESIRAVRSNCSRPRPQTAGYIFVLAAGTGISVTGGILPAYLSWWWLDKVGHVAGGLTLTLGLLILLSPTATAVSVVLLSILWEVFEWTVGAPFLVTPLDTKLDLLAGWIGLALALVVAGRESESRSAGERSG